jgi:hypothetical protein
LEHRCPVAEQVGLTRAHLEKSQLPSQELLFPQSLELALEVLEEYALVRHVLVDEEDLVVGRAPR